MVNQRIKEITLITIGSLLFAIGINYFAIPNRLSEGGIIGLTVVTYYLFDWSPGIVNFAINAILLAVGYKFFDKKTMIYTILGIVETSLFLYVTEHIEYHVNSDTLLAALFVWFICGNWIRLYVQSRRYIGRISNLSSVSKSIFRLECR